MWFCRNQHVDVSELLATVVVVVLLQNHLQHLLSSFRQEVFINNKI